MSYQETRKNAMELSEKMKLEDGVAGGLQHFIDYLPRDNFCCHVGLIMNEVRIARYRMGENEVKLGPDVAAMLVPQPLPQKPVSFREYVVGMASTIQKMYQRRTKLRIVRHAVTSHALGNPRTVSWGFSAGLSGCLSYVCHSPWYMFTKPDKYARSHGAIGCLVGLALASPFVCIVGNDLWYLCNFCGSFGRWNPEWSLWQARFVRLGSK